MSESILQDHDKRLTRLEEGLSDLSKALSVKMVEDAKTTALVQGMDDKVTVIQSQVDDMSKKMLDALLEEKRKNQQEEGEEKKFYRKLILTCVSIVATVILGAMGIKTIIPI